MPKPAQELGVFLLFETCLGPKWGPINRFPSVSSLGLKFTRLVLAVSPPVWTLLWRALFVLFPESSVCIEWCSEGTWGHSHCMRLHEAYEAPAHCTRLRNNRAVLCGSELFHYRVVLSSATSQRYIPCAIHWFASAFWLLCTATGSSLIPRSVVDPLQPELEGREKRESHPEGRNNGVLPRGTPQNDE